MTMNTADESRADWFRRIGDIYAQISVSSTEIAKKEANSAEATKYYGIAKRMEAQAELDQFKSDPISMYAKHFGIHRSAAKARLFDRVYGGVPDNLDQFVCDAITKDIENKNLERS